MYMCKDRLHCSFKWQFNTQMETMLTFILPSGFMFTGFVINHVGSDQYWCHQIFADEVQKRKFTKVYFEAKNIQTEESLETDLAKNIAAAQVTEDTLDHEKGKEEKGKKKKKKGKGKKDKTLNLQDFLQTEQTAEPE